MSTFTTTSTGDGSCCCHPGECGCYDAQMALTVHCTFSDWCLDCLTGPTPTVALVTPAFGTAWQYTDTACPGHEETLGCTPGFSVDLFCGPSVGGGTPLPWNIFRLSVGYCAAPGLPCAVGFFADADILDPINSCDPFTLNFSGWTTFVSPTSCSSLAAMCGNGGCGSGACTLPTSALITL